MRVITGTAKGVTLKTPAGLQTRPTTDRVKEGIFSSIQFEIPGRRVLDLFAGTGQMGIEALSRGARSAVFLDCRREAANLVRENLRRTRLESSAQVLVGDCLQFLSTCHTQFDLIFLDPPYATDFLEKSLQKITEFDILTDSGIIVTERPVEKRLAGAYPGLSRSKDYRYGKVVVTLLRKLNPGEDCNENSNLSGQL